MLFREVERKSVEVKQNTYVDDCETSGKFKQQEAEVECLVLLAIISGVENSEL